MHCVRIAAFALALIGSTTAFAADAAPAGDPARGEDIYDRCIACHALARNRTGPRHCGVVGRKAGSVPGFSYSKEMKRSGLTWDRETLDRFLENPSQVVPGTTMGYAGVKSPKERADLIAYLASAADDPELCPR